MNNYVIEFISKHFEFKPAVNNLSFMAFKEERVFGMKFCRV